MSFARDTLSTFNQYVLAISEAFSGLSTVNTRDWITVHFIHDCLLVSVKLSVVARGSTSYILHTCLNHMAKAVCGFLHRISQLIDLDRLNWVLIPFNPLEIRLSLEFWIVSTVYYRIGFDFGFNCLQNFWVNSWIDWNSDQRGSLFINRLFFSARCAQCMSC